MKAYAMDVHKGRISRTLFRRRDSKTEGVLELIHSDVCGPMPSSSINGYVCMYHSRLFSKDLDIFEVFNKIKVSKP
jgi:hypothetical protein